MSDKSNQQRLVLEVKHLAKAFPGVQALRDVRLEVFAGQVHAVMGENGAGKSTLMKVLIGLHQPDAGEIRLHGQPVQFRNPHAALRRGLVMMHQELMPFAELTVAENMFMGCEPRGPIPGWIDRRAMQRRAQAVLARLGGAMAPTRLMKELTVAEMQIVEMAKALVNQAEIIIMDEPTSAISEREVEALFGVIRELTQRGVAIIYISHKMEEIFRIANTVTVLRDGRYVATRPVAELDPETLIALMVGRKVSVPTAKTGPVSPEVVLAVRGLGRAGKFAEINFELRRGEVLGIAGLMGAGRTELACALYGLSPADTGEIRVRGQAVRLRSPAAALARGIGMVSEDRKGYGLVLTMEVKQNITLASLKQCCWGPLIRSTVENRVADESIRQWGIKTAGRHQTVEWLSGGNQQKVVLAKALLNDPDILILDEPTRGIDIGAKAEIYALIGQLAAAGKAILLISSELPELLALSDRILVMRAGRFTAELHPAQTTQEEILKFAMPA